MTRKDYVRIARALLDVRPAAANAAALDQWHQTCGALADVLARDNPRFDYMRFIHACGVRPV